MKILEVLTESNKDYLQFCLKVIDELTARGDCVTLALPKVDVGQDKRMPNGARVITHKDAFLISAKEFDIVHIHQGKKRVVARFEKWAKKQVVTVIDSWNGDVCGYSGSSSHFLFVKSVRETYLKSLPTPVHDSMFSDKELKNIGNPYSFEMEAGYRLITFFCGNGFDMALGLDTDYASFLNHYLRISHESASVVKLVDHIKQSLKDPSDARRGFRGENWSDAEIAFAEADYTSIFGCNNVDECFIECLLDFQKSLNDYLQEQQNRFVSVVGTDKRKLDAAANSFKRLLKGSIHRIGEQRLRNMGFDGYGKPLIKCVSFNYTNILDQLVASGRTTPVCGSRRVVARVLERMVYRSSNLKPDDVFQSDIDVVHIHGRVSNSGSTEAPVFGADNIWQVRDRNIARLLLRNPIFIKRDLISQQADKLDKEIENLIYYSSLVVVFGMSVGQTDMRWWKSILSWLSEDETHVLLFFKYAKNGMRPNSAAEQSLRNARNVEEFLSKINIGSVSSYGKLMQRIVVVEEDDPFEFSQIKAEITAACSIDTK